MMNEDRSTTVEAKSESLLAALAQPAQTHSANNHRMTSGYLSGASTNSVASTVAR
jgi:hypothetical protein